MGNVCFGRRRELSGSYTIDWDDSISVNYFSDFNSNFNRVISAESGQQQHHSANSVTFPDQLNESFIISYSDLMLNAQRAQYALHPILKKPKHSLNSRSFINFIGTPSCIETPDNIVSCHCLAKAKKNESCSPTPSGG